MSHACKIENSDNNEVGRVVVDLIDESVSQSVSFQGDLKIGGKHCHPIHKISRPAQTPAKQQQTIISLLVIRHYIQNIVQ